MRIGVLLVAFSAACAQPSVTDGVASRRDFEAALERAFPRGTPLPAAEARLRADGFTCEAGDFPSADAPDTLHALLCQKAPPDTLTHRAWFGIIYHDRARVDTVDAIQGGGPR